jgi:5-dehydro-4-deoxyglucarate dehydratase
MSHYSPAELRTALGAGLVSFPVTHTTPELSFDESAYREHLQFLSEYEVAGLFAPGGTGEFFSLTAAEVSQVLRATIDENHGRIPVLGSAGYGTSTAVEMAKQAETDGADGILLLPPYLTEATSEGLYQHVARVCAATSVGVVVYHRANARYNTEIIGRLVDEFDNFIGFKDGICDIDLMATLYAQHKDRLVFIGGLPTAETYALPYFELGATTYSSAIFNFAPQWALDFYQSARNGDRDAVYEKVRDFLVPYIKIRDRQPGYGVSIVKAGLAAAGRPAGPVRPPLSDLTDSEMAELATIVKSAI